MKKSLKFGITSPVPGETTKNLIKLTKYFEECGFDTVWFPDHILFMAKKLTPDVWSIITASTQNTTKVKLGAIGDPHRSHPAFFAHRLATIDHISNGRIFTCLGYGEKMNLDPYGIIWDKPLSRLIEFITIMRNLWKGETVDFDGEFYNLSQAELRIYPIIDNTIPVYIAATGPKALKTAGKYGDGWVTNAMPTRLFSKKSKTVDDQTKSRNKDKFEKCIYIFTSIAENKDEAYKTLDPIKHALIWPELLVDAGYDIEIEKQYKDLQYTRIMPNDPDMLRKFKEMGEKYYSREIVMDFVIAGSKKDVIKRIEEYINAGVNHFIFRDFSPNPNESINIFSNDIIPYFR